MKGDKNITLDRTAKIDSRLGVKKRHIQYSIKQKKNSLYKYQVLLFVTLKIIKNSKKKFKKKKFKKKKKKKKKKKNKKKKIQKKKKKRLCSNEIDNNSINFIYLL